VLSTSLARGDIQRGCGLKRTAGAVYLEVGASPNGQPLENFLVDAPSPYVTKQKIGVDFVQDKTTGVWHIFDHVGAQYYPFASDFLEEARLHGVSRKIARSSRFDHLTSDSRLYVVHPHAIVTNAREIHPHLPEHRLKHRCAHFARSGDDAHLHDPDLSCSRLWYGLAPANSTRITSDGGLLPERQLTPDTAYVVEPLPFETPAPHYASGIVAVLPITSISVIASKDGSHAATAAKLQAAVRGIPVNVRTD
jgi:hypothetical protein